MGAWWGPVARPLPTNPRHQSEGEIEGIAAHGTRLVLAGEATWTREPLGLGVLHHLRETVAHVPGADQETRLVLFGRSFDPQLRAVAAAEGARLVSVDDLYA